MFETLKCQTPWMDGYYAPIYKSPGFSILTEVVLTRPLLLVLHHEPVRLVFPRPAARVSGGAAVAGPGAAHLHPQVGQDRPGHARGVRNLGTALEQPCEMAFKSGKCGI